MNKTFILLDIAFLSLRMVVFYQGLERRLFLQNTILLSQIKIDPFIQFLLKENIIVIIHYWTLFGYCSKNILENIPTYKNKIVILLVKVVATQQIRFGEIYTDQQMYFIFYIYIRYIIYKQNINISWYTLYTSRSVDLKKGKESLLKDGISAEASIILFVLFPECLVI